MIQPKADSDLDAMREGGRILAGVLRKVLENVKVGVSELELDDLAEKFIREKGAEPAFKRVSGYKHTICVSTNEVVVHGIPTEYRFREGDVVGIDCGVFYKGFNTDAAETLRVSTINNQQLTINKKDEVDRFLTTGKKALTEAIKVARAGNRVGNISEAIQSIIEGSGYSVVRNLVGHGIGKQLHEEPEIPGFLNGSVAKTPLLSEGMTIAIEAIYNMGKSEVVYANDDNWTIKTKDNSLSGLFERTILVTGDVPEVLT